MDKKELRKFNIDIYGLSLKQHEYQFEFGNELFNLFEQDIVTSGSGVCNLLLDKSETMIVLDFDVEAKVELTCDVSLKAFDQKIATKKQIMVKFGEEATELDDDVVVMVWDTKTMNVAEYIYQFLLLEIPLKKVHPDLDSDRPDILYVSEAEEKEEEVDPRWEALKKLK